MARLRVFVSSTFYDLKYIRANLEGFIKSFGYEPVLFESGDIGFHPDLPLDESCYKEIENSHMQVLIIGGKYGSPATTQKENVENENNPGDVDSITKREFLAAIDLNIPVYFFVENGVLSEYATYKLNKKNAGIKYAHVDNENVFKLIELIYKRGVGNLIQGFTKFEDISTGLKNQWSHLFTELLKNRKTSSELNALNLSLSKLNSVTESLQTYSEAILKSVDGHNFDSVKKEVDEKIQQNYFQKLASDKFVIALATTYSLPDEFVAKTLIESKDFKHFVDALNKSSKVRLIPEQQWSSSVVEEFNRLRNNGLTNWGIKQSGKSA